jgi:hypothetical protein
MNTPDPNPYAPPTAPVADVGVPEGARERLRAWRLALFMLVVVHLAATLSYGWAYFELTRTGAVSLLAFLGGSIGSLCLYGASVFVAWGRPRGVMAFVAAAVFLAASLPGWGLAYVTGWLVAFGAVLAVCGAFLVRAMRKAA